MEHSVEGTMKSENEPASLGVEGIKEEPLLAEKKVRLVYGANLLFSIKNI